jgi:hypothetical protein
VIQRSVTAGSKDCNILECLRIFCSGMLKKVAKNLNKLEHIICVIIGRKDCKSDFIGIHMTTANVSSPFDHLMWVEKYLFFVFVRFCSYSNNSNNHYYELSCVNGMLLANVDNLPFLTRSISAFFLVDIADSAGFIISASRARK